VCKGILLDSATLPIGASILALDISDFIACVRPTYDRIVICGSKFIRYSAKSSGTRLSDAPANRSSDAIITVNSLSVQPISSIDTPRRFFYLLPPARMDGRMVGPFEKLPVARPCEAADVNSNVTSIKKREKMGESRRRGGWGGAREVREGGEGKRRRK